jgi:hypothetical protein
MVEVYRYMWIVVLELWAITEEKIQFNQDRDYRHDIVQELSIYQSFKDLYLAKILKIEQNIEKRRKVSELEEDFVKIAQKPGVMSKMKTQILGEHLIPKEEPKE